MSEDVGAGLTEALVALVNDPCRWGQSGVPACQPGVRDPRWWCGPCWARIVAERVREAERERDEAQEHLAYRLRDYALNSEPTGDLAVDMARYASRLRDRAEKSEAALAEAERRASSVLYAAHAQINAEASTVGEALNILLARARARADRLAGERDD